MEVTKRKDVRIFIGSSGEFNISTTDVTVMDGEDLPGGDVAFTYAQIGDDDYGQKVDDLIGTLIEYKNRNDSIEKEAE